MKPPSLEALQDRQAIMDLVHVYCRAADRRDQTLMRSLYHEDAIDDHGGFFSGPAMAFIDKLPDIQAPMRILHHNITTSTVVQDGDYAEGEHYVLAYHQVEDNTAPLDLLIGGRYLDKYDKRDGDWKFTYRAVLADWATINQPSTVDLTHPMIAGSHIGRADTQDPSYQLFRLLQPGQPAPLP